MQRFESQFKNEQTRGIGGTEEQPLRGASFWGEDVLKLTVVLAAQFCKHTKANAF